MEIHSMRIEHAVQNNAMSYAQRQQQNHRPSNHAQNAADIYKPSRSPVSTAGRYPYPTTSQLHQTTPGLAQRYQQTGTATAAYSGPAAYHRDYRQPRISLLHPEYGRGRQDGAMLPGGQAGQISVVHLDDGMGNQQQLQPLKKIRLQDHKDNVQPLRIDTREQPGTYNPQVEAISPTLPESIQEDQPHKPTKDDIIVKIAKTDREIARAESQISILKKKQQELEELALKPQVKGEVEEDTQPRHNSLPQKIYAENRKRAASAHAQLDSLGPKVEWPLYNQPTDSTVYHENKRKNKLFKRRLLEYFKKRHAEKETRNAFLTETYSKLMQEWIRKVDKIESSTKRKAKEAKNREFFEKVFPELRKQREDKERFNRVGARVKSEADMEEIMDNLQEQAMEDKKMRSYAVIPPILLDKREKEIQYKNNNGYVEDMETMYKNRQYINMWTPQEKEIFKEKYLQHPKNFVVISSYLDRKSVADCVHYYYTSKKTENYKQLLRKSRQRTRASKNTHKVNNAANSSVVDILTTGVTTRLQREQQQKTVVREATQNQDVASTSTATSHPYSQSSTTVSTSPASSQTATTTSTAVTSSATASNAPSPPSSSATAVISCSTPSTTSASSTAAATSSTTTSASTTTATTTVKQEPSASPHAASSAGPPEKFTDFNSFEEYNNQMNSKGATAQPVGGQYYGDEAAVKSDAPPLADVKMEVKVENESAPEAVSDQNANAVMENKKKKERRKDKDTDAMETSEDDSLEVPEKTIQGMCIVCNAQLGTHLHSRPLPPSQASQYGLREDQVPQNARVCNTCRCKVVRSRYTHCPLPNCPNPRGRVKRLRSFPQRLQDLPQDLKDALLAEFNIPSGVTKCCSACFNRIQRRLGPVEEWPEEEINRLKAALTDLGANWQALGEKLGKTPNQIRGFYSMNRKRLNLESCLGDRKPTLTDEEESGSSTSSCEDQPVTTLRSTAVAERERHSSDTASAAESPPAMAGSSQVPIKKEDYDSSATETADEAQTPDHYQGSATITPVVADGQPRQNASPLSVKDLVLNVIEFSLMKNPGNQQQGQNPPTSSGITPTISSILEQDLNDVTIVSEYSLNSQQQQQSVVQQQRQVRNDMNIAKLVTPLIGATITPVTGPIPQQQPQQEQVPTGRSDLVVLQVPDTNREPETLDLSIKKPREFHQPPTLHKQATPQAMHRQDPSPQQQYIYHQERKSPAYVRSAKQGSPKLGNPNPKAGSITLGTPIITQTRYDGLLRQMPPDPKMGSITQGTPIHIPHMPGDKRVYEIYKKIGGGPQPPPQQQQQQQPPQPAQGFPGQYRHQPYNVEQQLSSRQIINDYITSQQMLGRRNEKAQYYQPGGMHRTPPPPPPPQNQQQRQGVIQRHTRPPYLPPGHEALSSLVDVAVQQPSLPVPVTPPHEGLGKTMADNMRDQPHRFQIIQHQQNVRQQQQRLDEQRRAYHQQQVQQQQQQQHQQQQQQQQQQQIQQPRQQVQRSDSSTLTAASLIDAIITHQINQTAEGGREVMQNSREPPRAGDILFQSFHRNPPPPQVQDAMDNRPPSVINVEMDSESITKNMTVKELTDSVISHDYGARQPPPGSYYHMSQESVNEQWKRRLQQQQKENEKRSATPQQQQQHDERQIIRIAQPQQKYHVEPVSPPENNHWTEQSYRRFQQQPQSHMSPLDYVKNRIVEVMRTEDDKKENQENHQTEKRSESPGDMVIDEEKNEDEYHQTAQHQQQQQQQQSAYSTYPFVHKDMSVNDSGRRSNEPKPLLSAQYEPLSDED